jgi:hypothetical protein
MVSIACITSQRALRLLALSISWFFVIGYFIFWKAWRIILIGLEATRRA